MESEGPYNPYKHQTEMWGTKECDKQCKACIYAEGRKSMEKDFNELLDNTGFLATILQVSILRRGPEVYGEGL